MDNQVNSQITFNTVEVVESFTAPVEIAIPPDKPKIKGHITVEYNVMSKKEVEELNDEELTDIQYLRRITRNIGGLGNKAGQLLTGEPAYIEATEGRYSMYLVHAILQKWYAQYGEARRGNSRGRR